MKVVPWLFDQYLSGSTVSGELHQAFGWRKRCDVASLMDAFTLRARSDRPAYTLEGRTTPWSGVMVESATRAEILRNFLDPSQPMRFAIAVDDSPEYTFWLGAALLSGAGMMGLDPSRPSSLDRSAMNSSDWQFVVVDDAGLRYLERLGLSKLRTIDLKSTRFLALLEESTTTSVSTSRVSTDPLLCSMIIDSTSHGPVTFDVTDRRATCVGQEIVRATEMTSHDILYDPLPMSRAHSVLAGWAPAVLTGAEIVFQRQFSPTQFFSDVLEFNCTYFVYEGSMISELLDQPRSARDRDSRLRVGFGTDSTANQRQEFHDRFGCELIDAEQWRSTFDM